MAKENHETDHQCGQNADQRRQSVEKSSSPFALEAERSKREHYDGEADFEDPDRQQNGQEKQGFPDRAANDVPFIVGLDIRMRDERHESPFKGLAESPKDIKRQIT